MKKLTVEREERNEESKTQFWLPSWGAAVLRPYNGGDRVGRWSGAGGAGFWLNRQAGTHHGTDRTFGDFGEMFGENAAISELFDTVGAAQANDPAAFGFFRVDRRNFRERNNQTGLQTR